MPESDGKLSQAEKQKAADWLADKSRLEGCPVCGGKQMYVHDYLVGAIIVVPPAKIGSAVCPLLLLTCQDCGYAMQFTAQPILDL